jgi:hypothetical protein
MGKKIWIEKNYKKNLTNKIIMDFLNDQIWTLFS